MKGPEADKQRLAHILDSINEIQDYTKDASKDAFLEGSMVRATTVKQLEIIGEACSRISDATKEKFPSIDWRKVIALRNILVHEYFAIDYLLIWQILQIELPDLKGKIEGAIMQLGESGQADDTNR